MEKMNKRYKQALYRNIHAPKQQQQKSIYSYVQLWKSQKEILFFKKFILYEATWRTEISALEQRQALLKEQEAWNQGSTAD